MWTLGKLGKSQGSVKVCSDDVKGNVQVAIRGAGMGGQNGSLGHGRMVGWNPTLRLMLALFAVLVVLTSASQSHAQGVAGPPPGFSGDIKVPSNSHNGSISRFNFQTFIEAIESQGERASKTDRKELCKLLSPPCNGRFRMYTSRHFADVFFVFEGDVFSLKSFYLLTFDQVIATFPFTSGRKITFKYSFPENGHDVCEDPANFLASLWLMERDRSSSILYSVRAIPPCPTFRSLTLAERRLGGPYTFVSRDGSTGYSQGF